MSRKVEFILCRLDRFIIQLWIVALCAFLLGSPVATVLEQTDCTSYNQCPTLQGQSDTKN